MKLAPASLIGVVALLYACGAVVHALNMLNLVGIDWGAAPLKWQVLDVVYLIVVFHLVTLVIASMRIRSTGPLLRL